MTLADRWAVYAGHLATDADSDPNLTGLLRDAFMAGAAAGLATAGPDAALEYAAYVAAALKVDGTQLAPDDPADGAM